MKDFIRKYDRIYLPYLTEKFDIAPEELSKVICGMWDSFQSPRIVENMLVKNNKINCNFYEICDTKYERGKYIEDKYLESHCFSNNSSDQHVSVFRHGSEWITNYKRKGTVSCRNTSVSPNWIYLELDRDSYQDSLKDALEIYENFPYKEQMELWFSGNRSVHIAVHASLFGYPIGKQETVCGLGRLFYNIAHKISGDIRHKNGESDPWLLNESETLELYYKTFGVAHNKTDISQLKQRMENIDPNLFKVNSLIRQPWSLHEKTGNMKVQIEPRKELWIGNEFIPKKHYKPVKPSLPYLIHWIPEMYEAKYKTKPIIEVDIDESLVNKLFSHIDGFSPEFADANGWVNNLYSPFYEDMNPSVAVNVKTGYYKDFGDPTHSFGLVEFYSKLKGIEEDEAKRYIEQNR